MHKGVSGASICILMLAVLCYVYEVTVYTEIAGMRTPIGKQYPLRNLSFILGLLGILIFGVSIAVPSKTKTNIRT